MSTNLRVRQIGVSSTRPRNSVQAVALYADNRLKVKGRCVSILDKPGTPEDKLATTENKKPSPPVRTMKLKDLL